MYVKGLVRVRAQGFDHIRPIGNIGHKMPVHNIKMDKITARSHGGAHFRAKL